jgi:flagellar hook-length control protein FliK
MIPSDVASRLQLAADVALRPVAPAQEISDKLSGLSAGQRVMAEIQTLLPNGTYRAIINQRDITLSLPFSAKAGDSLELEIVDSDGKLTLATVARPPEAVGKLPVESVPTSLSRTGQLISNLFNNSGEAKSTPTPTPLNGNQPIASAPPASAQDILPLLKQAITQSGMFYESHQAEWVDGLLTKTALLQEPQGKLAPSRPAPASDEIAGAKTTLLPGAETARSTTAAAETGGNRAAGNTPQPTPATQPAQITQFTQLVAPEALPLVRQQLDALATQNFSWQGQVWPGQEMRWEIEEDAGRREQGSEDTPSNWQTRLRLTLPNLGGIDAQIRLQGNQISLVLAAGNTETQDLLRSSTAALRSQLDDAGLALASVGVGTAKDEAANGQTAV